MRTSESHRVSSVGFESLEGRQHFAATPWVINGTASGESYQLRAGDGIITLLKNNAIVTQRFTANVSSIQVKLNGGNDSFYMGDTLSNMPVTVWGGDGNDYISTGAGRQVVYGDSGKDSIFTGGGNDYSTGGFGNDSLNMGSGNDLAYGSDGDDIIRGGSGNDSIYGSFGNDSISGEAGNDLMYAGDGNDTLNGGTGKDRMFGESGDDRFYAANDGSEDGVSGGAGWDQAQVDSSLLGLGTDDSWSTVEIVQKF